VQFIHALPTFGLRMRGTEIFRLGIRGGTARYVSVKVRTTTMKYGRPGGSGDKNKET
jgi:hypothetical protein